MKNIFTQKLRGISIFLFALLSSSLIAEEAKFGVSDEGQSDKGPMFIGAVVGTIVVFGSLLFLKFRNDKKVKAKIAAQFKEQAKNPNVSRSRSQGRTAASRTRGSAS